MTSIYSQDEEGAEEDQEGENAAHKLSRANNKILSINIIPLLAAECGERLENLQFTQEIYICGEGGRTHQTRIIVMQR